MTPRKLPLTDTDHFAPLCETLPILEPKLHKNRTFANNSMNNCDNDNRISVLRTWNETTP